MGRVRADKGNASGDYSDVMVRQAFAGMHIDPNTLSDDGVSGRSPGGDGDETGGGLGPARGSHISHGAR